MIIRMRIAAAAAIAGAVMMVSSGTAALAVPVAPKAGVLVGARPGLGLAAGAGGSLLDVAASSARDAWLVEQLPSFSLGLLHWNGTAWSQTAIPSPSVNSVIAVAAVSAGNAWAVGQHCANRCTTIDTLILHWDGRAWRRVASPSPAGRADFLNDVSASSARNAWAAGSSCALATQACVPLMLHWNGRTWARVPSPAIGASAEPLAVTVASAASAWAVGRYCGAAGCYTPLAQHWNGTAWSDVAVPHPATNSHLSDVTATSASNAWAVGDYCTHGCNGFRSIAVHWNGTAWSQSALPAPGQRDVLSGVTATGPGNAWAVGSWCASLNCQSSRTLIVHWDGTGWSQVPSPSPGTGSSLYAVAATSASNAWAAGANCPSRSNQCTPVLLHWNGKTWATSRI